MAQHDYNIINQSAPAFRADLNLALEAIKTGNSGASAPSSPLPGMIWLDTNDFVDPVTGLTVTGSAVLKIRDQNNTNWITLGVLRDDGSSNPYVEFRNVAGRKFYSQSDVIGPVSQVGGIPTGALTEIIVVDQYRWIEKHFDGTLDYYDVTPQSSVAITTAQGGLFRSVARIVAYPTELTDILVPTTTARHVQQMTLTDGSGVGTAIFAQMWTITDTQFQYYAYATASAASASFRLNFHLHARWF